MEGNSIARGVTAVRLSPSQQPREYELFTSLSTKSLKKVLGGCSLSKSPMLVEPSSEKQGLRKSIQSNKFIFDVSYKSKQGKNQALP